MVGWGRAEWEKAKADGAVSEETFNEAIERGEFSLDDGSPTTQTPPVPQEWLSNSEKVRSDCQS